MRLGGTAKMLARDLPVETLQGGLVFDVGDGQGAIPRSGLDMLLHALNRRFAILAQQQQLPRLLHH